MAERVTKLVTKSLRIHPIVGGLGDNDGCIYTYEIMSNGCFKQPNTSLASPIGTKSLDKHIC